jgi:hypothetical protein
MNPTPRQPAPWTRESTPTGSNLTVTSGSGEQPSRERRGRPEIIVERVAPEIVVEQIASPRAPMRPLPPRPDGGRPAVPPPVAGPTAARPAPRTLLRELFGSRQALRRAVLIHEILGPPKALQRPGDAWSRPASRRQRPGREMDDPSGTTPPA